MIGRLALGWRVGLALGLAVAGLIALQGVGGGESVRATTASLTDVSIVDFAFSPSVVTVTTGSDVRWTYAGSFPHTSTSDNGVWNSGTLGPGGMFTYTFNAAGVYSYHCAIHSSMAGRVVAVTQTLSVCSTCPHTTIGAALAAAGPGDVIRVASGTYNERLTITRTLTLQGGWNAAFTTRTPGGSTVDAQGQGRAMTILGLVSPTIDGFALTGGNAAFEISGTHRGGGVYVEQGGALFVNNIITGNVATTSTSTALADRGYGGGVYVESGRVVISANQIVSNVAGGASLGAGTEAYGGGVYALGNPTLINNLIASNQARTGGGPYGYGGGAYVFNGVVRGNQFISNSASNGGGIASLVGDTTFDANLSRGTSGGNFILEAGGSSRLTNNFLIESPGKLGISAFASAIEIVNNTIVGLSGGIYIGSGSPVISNNLFYSNDIALDGPGTPVLDYNGFWLNGTDFNVSSTLTGTHNVFADPSFVAASGGDYHLLPGSPMIDAGSGAGAPSTDYDGQARPIGAGFDIGADEIGLSVFLPVVMKSIGP